MSQASTVVVTKLIDTDAVDVVASSEDVEVVRIADEVNACGCRFARVSVSGQHFEKAVFAVGDLDFNSRVDGQVRRKILDAACANTVILGPGLPIAFRETDTCSRLVRVFRRQLDCFCDG